MFCGCSGSYTPSPALPCTPRPPCATFCTQKLWPARGHVTSPFGLPRVWSGDPAVQNGGRWGARRDAAAGRVGEGGDGIVHAGRLCVGGAVCEASWRTQARARKPGLRMWAVHTLCASISKGGRANRRTPQVLCGPPTDRAFVMPFGPYGSEECFAPEAL